MHTPTGLYGLLRQRIDAFSNELERVEAGDPEGVHRARVASRRLRELVPLLALDRDVTRDLTRRLRKATKQLGIVRELDVEMLVIQKLAEDGRFSASALNQIGATGAQARAAARERLSANLRAGKLKGLARRLERVAKDLDSDDANSERRAGGSNRRWFWALEARLARHAGRVLGAIEAAGAVYVPEPLHGVRIAVKKLRYAAELAPDSRRKEIAADITVLKAAQDLLGRLHDFQMLLVRAREAQACMSPPDVRAWRDVGSVVHGVEDECRRLHGRYMHDRAGLRAIAHRMATSTQAQPVGRRTAS